MPLTSEEFVRFASMGNIEEFETLIQRIFKPTRMHDVSNAVADARTKIANGKTTFNLESESTAGLMERFATLTMVRERSKNKINSFLKIRRSERLKTQRLNACQGPLYK